MTEGPLALHSTPTAADKANGKAAGLIFSPRRPKLGVIMDNYPDDFVKAVNDLIDNWEGGYVNDPHDRGRATNMGISLTFLEKFKEIDPLDGFLYGDMDEDGDIDGQDIKLLDRNEVIAIYYREFWQKYHIEQVEGPGIRAKVFNMGVLMGPMTAKRLAVGCQTLDEYRKVCEKHFEAIVIRRPSLGRYLKGWRRRALA